jgi:hypothetical protein
MRKLLALIMVAVFAMTLAIALIGCGGQKTETTTEMAPPPEETSMPADTGMGAMSDTTTQH